MCIFQKADILLPKNADLKKWAVIACDQFTSDPDYWKRVRDCAGNAPSVIHMILPEAELEAHGQEYIERINRNMSAYLEQDLFQVYPKSYVYVERTLENGSIRPGLIGMVDLEYYDYQEGSVSPVRATEKTVLERIPPRKKVRQDAVLEFPHVLMLCDDDQFSLIEPIQAVKDSLPRLYDFDLMEDGGHIAGWLVSGDAAEAFDARFTAYSESYQAKYSDLTGESVLLAVGDGNHSLATAKSCYETQKAQNPGADLSGHPARYALVELENIHDPSQVFEPIHRILTGVDAGKLMTDIRRICGPDGYPVKCVTSEGSLDMYLDRGKGELAVAVLQEFLDDWLETNPGKIDYIHGADEVARLTAGKDAVGFLLPPMKKHSLFRGVIAGGVLPRKTFSMGHAREKRYYLEGRKIK